jgi:hypothetical protein
MSTFAAFLHQKNRNGANDAINTKELPFKNGQWIVITEKEKYRAQMFNPLGRKL